MKTLISISAILMVSFLAPLNAQLIEEDGTQVLESKRGEAVFTLEAGTKVYSYDPREDWYKVRVEVYVDPGQVVDDEVILANTELRDAKGNVIGKVVKEMKIEEGALADKFRGKKPYHAILEGYLFKTKFKDGSAPELWVSKIVSMKNRTDQQEEFQQLFEVYDFEEREFGEFTALVYREENKTIDLEKDFRIIIIMRGETPYAVISNDHSNVTAPKVKMESEDGPFKVIYFYKPPARQQTMIEDEILYTFLAL